MAKALVVDNELDICILVTRHLKSLGINADYALSIEEALLKTTNSAFGLYIIDLNLGNGSGYKLIHELKKMHLRSKIIMISANEDNLTRALERGADYFVAKPLSKRIINDALKVVEFS